MGAPEADEHQAALMEPVREEQMTKFFKPSLLSAEGLTRRQWSVLGITMLFWLFDGYETFALLLTIGPSLHQLLPANELSTLPRIAAYLISITLFGWAVGGVYVGDGVLATLALI